MVVDELPSVETPFAVGVTGQTSLTQRVHLRQPSPQSITVFLARGAKRPNRAHVNMILGRAKSDLLISNLIPY